MKNAFASCLLFTGILLCLTMLMLPGMGAARTGTQSAYFFGKDASELADFA